MRTSDWVIEDNFVCRGHRMVVPLDYKDQGGVKIEVFIRELRRNRSDDKPYLLYLQGGPGFEVARPATLSAWQDCALDSFNVVLMDQRGTGLSTPFEPSVVSVMGDESVVAYLGHLRADNIVRDAEHFRSQFLGKDKKWSLLGQSFGGFCSLTYLSYAPEGLERVMLTGGVAPVGVEAEAVYRALLPNVRKREKAFFQHYPDAVPMVESLLEAVETGDYQLPSGDPLHVERVRSLGIMLGRGDGEAMLFRLLEMSSVRGPDGRLTQRFLHAVEKEASIVVNPIYAVLHEAIYCEHRSGNWAAQRVKDSSPSDRSHENPVLFDGEMIFPWMFDDIQALRPLKSVAHQIAEKSDWPNLYDEEALRRNTVPVAALVYDEDMFVDRQLSVDTMDDIGASVVWSTNEYEHNGLRVDGRRIFSRLLRLTKTLE